MKPYSFGRLNVAAAGTPVQLGSSVLAAPVAIVDGTIKVSNANVFSKDMLPFNAFLANELVTVTAINFGTGVCTVTRLNPVVHPITDVLQINFQFSRMFLSSVVGLTGKMYLGTVNLVAAGVGVIKEFIVPTATFTDSFTLSCDADQRKDLFNLIDYKIDAAVNGEGLYITVWKR